MNRQKLLFTAACACLMGLGLASGAQAASTWQFSGASTATKTGDAADPTLSAFAGVYAANGGTFDAAATSGGVSGKNFYGITGFAAGSTWSAGVLGYSGGSGITMSSDGGSSPNHAFDNGPSSSSGVFNGVGNTEALLLNFSSSVVLTGMNIGWTGSTPNNDTDISLFRYVGAVAPSMPLGGLGGTSLASMTSAGWSLVSNYSNVAVDAQTALNGGNLSSSWWLISSYNQAYGGNMTQGNDFMKIFSVSATKCTATVGGCGPGTSVPEPSSLALIGIGLFGAVSIRRRRTGVAPMAA